MKKVLVMCVSILLIVAGSWLYLQWRLLSYEPMSRFYDVPIPKAAQLDKETARSVHYVWEAATFEYGLPLDYRYALRQYGWKKQEPIDTIAVYQKDGQELHFVVTTDYLEIVAK